jgi:hypothetical protein
VGVGEAVGVEVGTMIVAVSGIAVGGRLEPQPFKARERTIVKKKR